MTRSDHHRPRKRAWRSLVIVALVNLGVLVTLPEAGFTDQDEGSARIFTQIVPDGYLIEGRYANDPIIRLVKSEPLVAMPSAYRMPAF